jgi:hypothetical protein
MSDMIGIFFVDVDKSFRVTGTNTEDEAIAIDYKDKKGNQYFSIIDEVRQWIQTTNLTQAANASALFDPHASPISTA